MVGWSGGCLCGAVRYELRSEPFDCGWCHCSKCRLASGAPALAFASVPAGDLVWTEGEDKLRVHRSTSFGERGFCGECGTALFMRVDHQPETIDFTVATLDEPGRITPGFHIFWGSRVSWFDTADALPTYDQFRPETRGLAGTEPPAD